MSDLRHTALLMQICHELSGCDNKEQLTATKAKYEVATVKQAWAMLDSPIKDRIKDLCEEAPKLKERPRLWEISGEMTTLENIISDLLENESIEEDKKEALMSLAFCNWLAKSGDFEQKALMVANYIKHQEALSEARKAEYRRLWALAEQAEKQAERLRGYLVREMQKTNKARIEGATGKLSLRKKPKKVLLNCEPQEIPSEFVKVEFSPKLNAIKDYLKDHPDCDWAYLSHDESCLLIK
jgi:hypothetical protein